jgi:hypothetical protein
LRDVPLTEGLGLGRLSEAATDRAAESGGKAGGDCNRRDAETMVTLCIWMLAG